MIDSWESFVDAVDLFIKMDKDNAYRFEPKAEEKKMLRNEIEQAISQHRKKVEEIKRNKQLSLFD